MLNRGVNMAKVLETKKKICRYVYLDKCVGEVKCFGWELTNKILLNRFGNPLNPNEDISESDLREKCSYELSLTREVEKESISQLNSLEFEYESMKYLPNHFSGGRITGCVFLTIAIIVFSILIQSLINEFLFSFFFHSCSTNLPFSIFDFIFSGNFLSFKTSTFCLDIFFS